MKHVSLRYQAAILCAATVILIYPSSSFAQEPLAPLTRDELIDLVQRPSLKQNPERVLAEFVSRNKIAFLPTRRVIDYLNRNGVPKLITDKLKYNFASRIVYRVCQFEPINDDSKRFTQILNRIMETEKLLVQGAQTSILRDKTFEPVPAGPTGPIRQELDQHTGYVLIMGNIEDDEQNPQRKVAIARLVFVSRVQERMSIAPSLIRTMDSTRSSQEEAARAIARWSIEEVEKQIE